jgi:hypothetical protein
MGTFPIDGLEDVPGFLTPAAAWLLDGLGRRQVADELRGDIAEIGVYYGRSALVLGRTLAPGEHLVACDSFQVGWDDVPGWRFRPSGAPEDSLRRRWADIVGDLSSLIVRRGDSLELSPADLGADPRLVHVDGGHAYDRVRHDARIADEALQPGGVVVFDDVLLAEWPDVTVAVIDHLRSRGSELIPFLVAEHKTFACRRQSAASYREWAHQEVAQLFRSQRYLVVDRSFLGEETTVVSRLPA